MDLADFKALPGYFDLPEQYLRAYPWSSQLLAKTAVAAPHEAKMPALTLAPKAADGDGESGGESPIYSQ
jgi:hypothetical protein